MVEQSNETQMAGQAAPSSELTIRVPASAANLGPGLDTVALAVQLYLTVKVKLQSPSKSGYPEIITEGTIAQKLTTDNTNHIAKVIQKLWPQDPRILSCLKITIDSQIPLAKGLGSSAAATVSAATAVLALCGMPLQKGVLFAQAAEIEGYPNNAGAALFGGFTICAPNIVQGDILARKIEWPEKWSVIAAVPPYSVPSKKTRAALPASISHKDAVTSVQKVALLIEAVAAGDEEAMRAALRDKLHEPFQSKFVPELSDLRKILQEFDVLGTVLSGGGPTILTITNNENKQSVLDRLNSWSSTQKEAFEILELPVDHEGLFVTCG